jgi:hypothetical protein
VVDGDPRGNVEVADHLRGQHPDVEEGQDEAVALVAAEVLHGVGLEHVVAVGVVGAGVVADAVPVEGLAVEAVERGDADVVAEGLQPGHELEGLGAVAGGGPCGVAVPQDVAHRPCHFDRSRSTYRCVASPLPLLHTRALINRQAILPGLVWAMNSGRRLATHHIERPTSRIEQVRISELSVGGDGHGTLLR